MAKYLEQHRRQILESAIRGVVADTRGYRSVRKPEDLLKLGFSRRQSELVPALLIPIWDVYKENSRFQIRPDKPRFDEAGKERKYENLPGVGVTLDINPLAHDAVMNWKKPLWITEGIKKADALVSLDQAAIALYSVWNWIGADESGAIRRLPEWDEVPLKGTKDGQRIGRKVYIVFDSDVMRKRSVKLALERLGRFLTARGARVRYIYLPEGSNHQKIGVDDYLAAGGEIKDFRKASRERPVGFPEIVLTARHVREVSQDTLEVLEEANVPAQLFQWASVLGRVRTDERGRPMTEAISPEILLHHMSMTADFVTVRTDTFGRRTFTPAHVPRNIAADVLARGRWPFPVLQGVTESPTLRPDGTIIDRPGYDRETGLYYLPDPDFVMDPVPEAPTEKDVEKAVKRLLYLVHDFPFVGDGDLTNYFALLLTPIVRPSIAGPVPLAGLDAPQQGSGKTLLAELVARIATGRPAETQQAPKNEEEWQKTILAELTLSPALTVFDNVMGVTSSGTLSSALTSETFKGRVLGVTKVAALPVRTTWIFNGNNLRFGGDLPRRFYNCKIDPQMAEPWRRTEDKFLQADLPTWTLNQRAKLLWSLLVLARAWWTADQPNYKPEKIGRFEEWCHVVGNILAHAGAVTFRDREFRGDAFLGNLTETYADMDIESESWGPFLVEWRKRIEDEWLQPGELAARWGSDFAQHLPDEVADAYARGDTRRLGWALTFKLDRYYRVGKHQFAVQSKKKRGKKVYRVVVR